MTNARQRLLARYDSREAAAMVDEMLFRLKGWDRTATIIHAAEPASDFVISHVNEVVSQLLEGKPIQYIFGVARFYGMDFKVTPATLIPRPETAQLCDIIIDRYGRRSDLAILDLCTGSGCIAITLARNIPFPRIVSAVDISADALSVARDNAKALNVNVNFIETDILKSQSGDFTLYGSDSFDIIVSNPPYIVDSERASMDSNVLDYEPSSALFVPDDDPLRFYRAIVAYASTHLAPGGTLFLEINPLFSKELVSLLKKNGFADIVVEKDMQKSDRFIIASL